MSNGHTCKQPTRLLHIEDGAASNLADVRQLDVALGKALAEIGGDLASIKAWMARLDKHVNALASRVGRLAPKGS